MQISWHGQYTVKVTSKETTLVLDPYSPNLGIAPFRAKAELVALSNPSDPSMSNTSGIQGTPLLIDSPGEYSFREFSLYSIGWSGEDGKERSLQRWTVEDMVVLHVGSLDRALNEQELQELERVDIDVFLAPVGGGNGLTMSQVMNMISTIEPRVVIPIHYSLPGLTEKLDSLKAFTQEMGITAPTPEKKVILKKNKLPSEDMQMIILAP